MQTMKLINQLKDNLPFFIYCMQKQSPLVCIRMHPFVRIS
jgi:hypothetical protein